MFSTLKNSRSAYFHPFFLHCQRTLVSRHDALMIPLRSTEGALHALLPVFGGARLVSLGEFGRGFVELLFPLLHGCRVSSFNGLGKDDFSFEAIVPQGLLV